MEISLVLGTAGHIDHGKTSLVKAITGVDCDRLVEEKKRGITIELGFAPLSLDDGRVVSIVDVPGHERFIRQMVAGASGVDAVLFIVAADEGVMPQTREHLSILHLLGVKNGIVVITKSDKVEPDFLLLVQEDIRELMKGTFLESAPVVPVSAHTGENISALLGAIKKLVDNVRPRARKGALFLPIDRAFAVAGFGTVITGTAHHGTIHPNDEVEIFPSCKKGRVRSVQVHGKDVEEGWAGQRIAASIAGVSLDELARGDVVCAGGVYRTTKLFNATLEILPSVDLKHWQRVHLLIGTSEVLARVSLGDGNCVQIFTEEEIICTYDQKFILRFYSPLATVAGGTVIFPYPKRERRKNISANLAALASAKNIEERLRAILEMNEILTIRDAAILLQQKNLDEKLLSKFIIVGDTLMSAAKFQIIRALISAPENDEINDAQKNSMLEFCKSCGFQPPLIEEVQAKLNIDAKEIKNLLDVMKNSKEISIVSGFVLSSEIELKLLDILRSIKGEITLALVRDATASSRKYILPLLEYFDAKGVTRRVGEIRIFR